LKPISAGSNLYDILGVRASATSEELKCAYRKLALIHHPDRNANSADSTVRFTVILNAYRVLSDTQTRQEYDAMARSPESRMPTFRSYSPVGQTATRTEALHHLNFILWDIEDFIRAKHNPDQSTTDKPIGDYLLMMLSFIDRWVLEKAGFPDYFHQARKITPAAGNVPTLHAGTIRPGSVHRPYANLEDYFYAIRMRSDKLISAAKLVDLLAQVPGKSVRLIDCILEAHNYCAHYLGGLRGIVSGRIDDITPFHHSNECYDE